MSDFGEMAALLTGCIICRQTPIVAIFFIVPVDDATYSAIVTLRETPIADGHTPILRYGLCRAHAQDVQRSAARAHALVLAAAEGAVVQ